MRLASSGDQVDGGGGTEHSERNEEMEEDGTGGVCAGQVQAEGQSERSAKLTVLLPLLGLCAITTRCFDTRRCAFDGLRSRPSPLSPRRPDLAFSPLGTYRGAPGQQCAAFAAVKPKGCTLLAHGAVRSLAQSGFWLVGASVQRTAKARRGRRRRAPRRSRGRAARIARPQGQAHDTACVLASGGRCASPLHADLRQHSLHRTQQRPWCIQPESITPAEQLAHRAAQR
jgi:hypothetical protein